jgi:hypothetical protein
MRVRTRNAIVIGGVVSFAIGGFCYPLIYLKYFAAEKMIDSAQKSLPTGHNIRGAFINSGSRDAGPDPDAHHAAAVGYNPVKR